VARLLLGALKRQSDFIDQKISREKRGRKKVGDIEKEI